MKINKSYIYRFIIILIDVCQKLEPISNNTINSNNSIVNINMFLNEQCKDAMNMTEFIESIQLSLEDMMNIATTGQTQGMTSILIDRLSSLDVLKRPLHCSDLKKETIYIKDEDKWEQDSKTKPKMKSVLDKLTMYKIFTYIKKICEPFFLASIEIRFNI